MAADEPELTHEPEQDSDEELDPLHRYTYSDDTNTLQRVLDCLNEQRAA